MLVLALLFAACGGLEPLPEDTGNPATSDTPEDSPDNVPTDTPTDTPSETPSETPSDTGAPRLDTASPADTPADTDTAVDTDGSPTPPPWSHTIVVDGDPTDWFPTETFLTSTGAATALRVTWDATYLYLATTEPDVATGGPEHWFVVYLGDDATGANTGLLLNTQEPAFQRPMRYALRRKANGTYDSFHDASSGGWGAGVAGWLASSGALAVEAGDTLELALPWSAFTLPDRFTLITMWVYEGAGFESTYTVSPHAAPTPPPPAVYDLDVAYPLDFFRALGP